MRKILVLICLLFITILLGCDVSKDITTSITQSSSISLVTTKTQETTLLSTSTTCVHDPILIKGTDSTCFDDGYTDGVICSKCGEVIEKSEVIPAGHKMEFDSLITKKMDGLFHPSKHVCKVCGFIEYKDLTYKDLNLPILSVNGSLEGISKDNKVQVKMTYEDETKSFETLGTMKYQGASSLYYPKHNFNIQFLKEDSSKFKIEMIDGWGKESKYCLKANYVDFSQARNVVCAKLYGDVVHSREIDDEFNELVNGGAIDGFPIVVYIENEFQGIYTFNIPKDKWMFGMGDGDKEAILMADAWGDSVSLREHVNDDYSNGWDLEYCSTGDSSWVVKSFNNMMDVLKLVYLDESYINLLDDYINVDRAIDSMLFTFMISAADNSAKNILWVTYDGKIWTPSMYDMDGVLGLYWDGSLGITKPTDYMPESWSKTNLLWQVLMKYKKTEVALRYFEIRQNTLTSKHVREAFSDFIGSIGDFIYEADKERWKKVPSQETNNIKQIFEFVRARFECLDEYFASLIK